MLFFALSTYSFQKWDILVNKKDIDILSTQNDLFFDYNDRFTYQNGFNFAVAFTDFGNNPEPILDPSYGSLVFNHYYWGEKDKDN